MKNFVTHWKTTVNGLLAFLIVTLTTLSGYLGTSDLVASGKLHTPTYVVTGINLALALCRAWVGFLQCDAGAKT